MYPDAVLAYMLAEVMVLIRPPPPRLGPVQELLKSAL